MSVLSFAYYYYKSSSLGNIYKPYQISVSDLKATNNGLSGKKEDLIRAFTRSSIMLLDDRLEIISINATQLKFINKVLCNGL